MTTLICRPKRKLILVGAPKCGTTTLANLLGQHPQMVLAKGKEPNFFTDYGDLDWAGPKSDLFVKSICRDEHAYERLFDNTKGAAWGIDASTDYLSNSAFIERAGAYAKRREVKLIGVLRDPVARAFSEYAHTIRDNYQQMSFRDSLAHEEERIAAGWHPAIPSYAPQPLCGGACQYN